MIWFLHCFSFCLCSLYAPMLHHSELLIFSNSFHSLSNLQVFDSVVSLDFITFLPYLVFLPKT